MIKDLCKTEQIQIKITFFSVLPQQDWEDQVTEHWIDQFSQFTEQPIFLVMIKTEIKDFIWAIFVA